MKHDDPTVAALRGVGLFQGLDDKALAHIAQQTKPYSFDVGDTVIDADSSGRFGRLYVVVSGTAEAQIHDEAVASFGPNDHFGEMSVLDGSPRSAGIVATSELHTLGLSAWNMRTLMTEQPEIAMHIIETLVARLRKLNEAMYD